MSSGSGFGHGQQHYSLLKAAINQTLRFLDAESIWRQSREHGAAMIQEGEQAATAWGRHNELAAGAIPLMPGKLAVTARRIARLIREQVSRLTASGSSSETLAEKHTAIRNDVTELQDYFQRIIPPDDIPAMVADLEKYGGLPRWFVEEQPPESPAD